MNQNYQKHCSQIKRGCLLINLGSPAKAETKEIRKFLRRFLSDSRVVTWHKALWYPILYGIVLPRRPRKIMSDYQKIWLDNGSPLTVYTAAQAQLLAAQLPEVMVRHGFSYSTPTITEALDELMDHGVTDLTILPLYPQYAPSTVGTTLDQITKYFARQNLMPSIKFISSWQLSPKYIAWYVHKLAAEIHNTHYDSLVFSYHSLPDLPEHAPQEYVRHCTQTTNAILSGLQNALSASETALPNTIQTYQSKFGLGKWLGPATIDTMAQLPESGQKSVLVCTPGFISDCIETIAEIGMQNMTVFHDAGGETFKLLPPPNDDFTAGEILAEVYRNSPQQL